MLEFLHIKNLALIEDMSLEFGMGMNVLTGETGAGKSFILKALNFVLGDKLSADIVRPGAEKAQVEALFTLNGTEYILRRELYQSNGRSRFYINDALSSQESLKELRPQLISYTSQHAQQQLMQQSFQAQLLENDFAKPELLHKRDELLDKLKALSDEMERIRERQGSLQEKRELLEMQKQEIDKVDPRPGEEEKLEELRQVSRARKNTAQNYNKAMAILYGEDGPGLLDLLKEFERILGQLNDNDKSLANDLETVSQLRGEITQITSHLRRPSLNAEKIDIDKIEARLFELSQLKRKLKRTLPQIMTLHEEIDQNLSFLDVCALDLSRLQREQQKIAEDLREVIQQIEPLRHETAAKFSVDLQGQLKDLGFSEHVRVTPEFAKQEIWPGIFDLRGKIFWAPNPGQKPQPLDKIASGGELSRFLLGLTTLYPQNSDLTYIFDEVDAGVGGLTLQKVGETLHKLSEKHQIILITHWPQLAAKAVRHFQITKTIRDETTFTQCAALDKQGRNRELARMAGGGKQGELLAKNLLESSEL